jgi:hypothetical protein
MSEDEDIKDAEIMDDEDNAKKIQEIEFQKKAKDIL